MSEKANHFKLGLFVISATALGIVFLAILGAGDFLKKEILAETCFDTSVQGLDVGSPVKYRGIEIGRVKSISSAAGVYDVKTYLVLVVIDLSETANLGMPGTDIKAQLKQAITDGLTIRLAIQGLTGTAYLETDFTDLEDTETLRVPWKSKNPYIPSTPNTITRLGDALDRILKNLESINIHGIVTDLERLMNTLTAKIDALDMAGISDEAENLLAELRSTNKGLRAALDSDSTRTMATDLKATLAGARSLVEDAREPFKETLGELKHAAGKAGSLAENLDTRLGKAMDGVSSELAQLMTSLDSVIERLDTLIWMNTGNIDTIIGNLKSTSENLMQMSQDLRRYPSRLLFENPGAEDRKTQP